MKLAHIPPGDLAPQGLRVNIAQVERKVKHKVGCSIYQALIVGGEKFGTGFARFGFRIETLLLLLY